MVRRCLFEQLNSRLSLLTKPQNPTPAIKVPSAHYWNSESYEHQKTLPWEQVPRKYLTLESLHWLVMNFLFREGDPFNILYFSHNIQRLAWNLFQYHVACVEIVLKKIFVVRSQSMAASTTLRVRGNDVTWGWPRGRID